MKQVTTNRPAKARGRARKVAVDFRKLKTIPILRRGEKPIAIDEALRRARANPLTNRGMRFAEKLTADLSAGRVSCKNLRIGQYVIFAKDSLRLDGGSCVWVVFRHLDGFCCLYRYLTGSACSDCRLLRLDR